MGLESRRKSLEKSDLDSLKENKWKNNQTQNQTRTKAEELQSIKDLFDSMSDEPIFNEQEAGKATINTKVENKDDEKLFEELSNEEILKRIDNLFR